MQYAKREAVPEDEKPYRLEGIAFADLVISLLIRPRAEQCNGQGWRRGCEICIILGGRICSENYY